MNFDQRIKEENLWLDRAAEYATDHPDAMQLEIIDALGNEKGLLVVPLAGAAIARAEREREAHPCGMQTEGPACR